MADEAYRAVFLRVHPTGKMVLSLTTESDGNEPQWASQMIHDASLRAQHEDAIVNLVVSKGYDGIDLDYEHLPNSDRDAFSTFSAILTGAMSQTRWGYFSPNRFAISPINERCGSSEAIDQSFV